MANPSKAIGTRAETKVARYLTGQGLPTERKALAGSADQGDLRMLSPDGTEVTLEVKAGKQTGNYRRSQLKEWQQQAVVEGRNSKTQCVLVIVRYRRGLVDAEVWVQNEGKSTWTMMYLDEFAHSWLTKIRQGG